MHLGRMSSDTKINYETIYVDRFDNFRNGKPEIPIHEGLVISTTIKDQEGLYIHGGKVTFIGKLKNLFNFYIHDKECFTKYHITWCKLKFNNGIITLLIFDNGTSATPLGSHNGEKVDHIINDGTVYPVQRALIKKTLEYLANKEPLPNPPVTYQIL